jgi:hypothetical protein
MYKLSIKVITIDYTATQIDGMPNGQNLEQKLQHILLLYDGGIKQPWERYCEFSLIHHFSAWRAGVISDHPY